MSLYEGLQNAPGGGAMGAMPTASKKPQLKQFMPIIYIVILLISVGIVFTVLTPYVSTAPLLAAFDNDSIAAGFTVEGTNYSALLQLDIRNVDEEGRDLTNVTVTVTPIDDTALFVANEDRTYTIPIIGRNEVRKIAVPVYVLDTALAGTLET